MGKMKKSCENLLSETLVNRFGLSWDRTQVQIRGDASIRETAPSRSRYSNFFDEHIDLLEKKFLRLLLETGVYHLGIGCHNGEIITRRVYDPFTYEVHEVEKFITDNYIERQFPLIGYRQKIDVVRKVNTFFEQSDLKLNLSRDWLDILIESNASWQPMSEADVEKTVKKIKLLRSVPEYYLRKMTICLIQGIVEMQFNCDGTVIIRSSIMDRFIEENF